MGGAAGAPCDKGQFEPILKGVIPAHPVYAKTPGLYGFGPGAAHPTAAEAAFWTERFAFNIVDKVEIPAGIPAGEYVLGLRWDCEQTPQIWSNCADVTVTG